MNKAPIDTARPVAKQRKGFTAIALALPFVLLGLVELALRFAGVGGYPPLFVQAATEGYLQPNEAAMARFFAHPEQAPDVSIDTTYFRENKSDDALRIVVQGGSSAAGFPYGKWASPAGMIKHRLRASFPEREIEVISTAMSAVNSYSLLDFAEEVVEIEPDAVIIYAGHNEYLGVLGVGSTFSSSRSPALTRLILTLRRLHLYRAMETLLARVPDAPPTGTLMARIAGERSIAFDSELYRRGKVQFQGNMNRLLAHYRSADIPVFIGTLASNQRDQVPFASALRDPSAESRWRPLADAGRAALARQDAAAATESFTQAIEVDEGSAEVWFGLGESYLAAGDREQAAEAFSRARDYDQLRFRAPSEFNLTIRELAEIHDAMLVDVEAALAANSEGGIVGADLMLEHLHPNARGYFLLADAFFDALLASGLVGASDGVMDDDEAWRRRPVTRIDELAAGYRLTRLLADWPFEDVPRQVALPSPRTPEEQIAMAWYTGRLTWPDAMNRALVYYQQQNDINNAVRVALNLAEAFHFLGNVQYIAGQLLVKRGDDDLAVHYLERAVELEPVTAHYLGLAVACRRSGRTERALAAANEVLMRDPGNREARAIVNQLTN